MSATVPDDALFQQAGQALAEAADLRAWDAVRVQFLGKQGHLTTAMKELGRLPPDERRARGAALNVVKERITEAVDARRATLEAAALSARLAAERIDVTLPPPAAPAGLLHPINRTMEEMAAIFGAMGFRVVEGPDVEGDWHNFSALNIPAHHPARADQDTFYVPGQRDGHPLVLRTHTSPVQVRTLLNTPPPFRVLVPGRTYRSDSDATHTPMFHQVEGMVIDRDITLGHLKGCLIDFLRAFFGISNLPVRFRSSYFPFTEPSMEVDIGWDRRSGQLGGGGDWLEILGSGMVHPRLLANCGLDPREWQGFAFGMGIDRVTMLKHAIPDLRTVFDNDVRWLRHYGMPPAQGVGLHQGVG